MKDFYYNELFNGISPEEFDKMLTCFQPVKKSFGTGEIICDYALFSDSVGIIHGGEAQTLRYEEDGSRTILENLGSNSIFGKIISFVPSYDYAVEVVCKKPCTALFLDYRHIVKQCRNSCEHHSRLVENILRLMSRRAIDLSLRIELLSRRSIRAKLLAYFKSEEQKQNKPQCAMSLSYSDLADYLCIDRCAMMRELKKMRDENLIITDGKTFALT